MKLTDKAQKTLDALFASGDGKHSAGGVVFGTTVIYNAGRANGMKYRTIKETFMSDALKVGYGKYNLYPLKTTVASEQSVPQAAPQPSLARAAKKTGNASVPMTEKQKHAAMIKASENWEVVYDSATDESLNS